MLTDRPLKIGASVCEVIGRGAFFSRTRCSWSQATQPLLKAPAPVLLAMRTCSSAAGPHAIS